MAFRHRPEYDESVPQALIDARAAYDAGVAEQERTLLAIRAAWSDALAEAIEAGMSYQEIVDLVGVSHSSVAHAMRKRRQRQG